jgi:hypothetical protein
MPVVDQFSPVTTSEQQAVPVAQDDRREALLDILRVALSQEKTGSKSRTAILVDTVAKILEFDPALPLPCKSGEGAEAIAAAIKATEYKYFGDYEMSDGQREAVDTLADVARNYLRALQPSVWDILQEARDQLEYLNGRWPTRKTPAIITRINTVPQYSPTLPDATQTREAELVAALDRLERANDAVAAATTRERYLTDLADVQPALLELDDARNAARAVLNARDAA